MPSNKSIRIGDYWFEPSTGELNNGIDSNAKTGRLSPQPAQLLGLLIERHPDLVSHQEIQQLLWPGVTKDFDRNLHFCIRQIRSAFNESAAKPCYIETIPRRGYRLIADMEKRSHLSSLEEQAEAVANGTAGIPNPARNRIRNSMIGLCIIIPLFVFSFIRLAGINGMLEKQTALQSEKVRIAIMPFTTEREEFKALGNGEIAFDLLEQLTPYQDQIDSIGPSTTEPYVKANVSLREMVDEIETDFVINAKFISNDQQHRLLVEIIRANDGSHVWVKYFDNSTSNREIARQASAALRNEIAID